MCIPLHIPVKPHVKKYLIHTVGDPYKISENDFVGLYLRPALKRQHELSRYDSISLNYPAIFHVLLTRFQYYDMALNTITSLTIMNFNQYIDSIFRHNFLTYIDVTCIDKKRNDIKNAVELYKNKYDISEEDISWDSLYKYYYRYRKGANLRILKVL